MKKILQLITLFTLIATGASAQSFIKDVYKPGRSFHGTANKFILVPPVFPTVGHLPTYPARYGNDSTKFAIAAVVADSSFYYYVHPNWIKLETGGGGSGTVTSITGTAPITVTPSPTSPNVSIAQATSSADGYLSAADWINFNSKLSAELDPNVASHIKAITLADLSNWTSKLAAGDTVNLSHRIDTIPRVITYGKNAGGDSTILTLNNGQRFAALDMSGGGGEPLAADKSILFYKANLGQIVGNDSLKINEVFPYYGIQIGKYLLIRERNNGVTYITNGSREIQTDGNWVFNGQLLAGAISGSSLYISGAIRNRGNFLFDGFSSGINLLWKGNSSTNKGILVGEQLSANQLIHSSAIFELDANSRGFLTVRQSTAQWDGIPSKAPGLQSYILDKKQPVYYDGTTTQMIVGMTFGTAAPTAAPTATGNFYLDTTNKKLYVATGIASSSDWEILN